MDLSLNNFNVEEKKSNKCSQCDFACSDESALRTHLKTHDGEKLKLFNQCDLASSQASNLRTRENAHWRKVEQVHTV